MSDSFAFADSKEFTDFMLNLPLATNKAALQYGFGFGEDFELDYEAFMETHTYKLPKAICACNWNSQGVILPHLPTHPPQVLQLAGVPPTHLSLLLTSQTPIPLRQPLL
jgi:hypothetical protein